MNQVYSVQLTANYGGGLLIIAADSETKAVEIATEWIKRQGWVADLRVSCDEPVRVLTGTVSSSQPSVLDSYLRIE